MPHSNQLHSKRKNTIFVIFDNFSLLNYFGTKKTKNETHVNHLLIDSSIVLSLSILRSKFESNLIATYILKNKLYEFGTEWNQTIESWLLLFLEFSKSSDFKWDQRACEMKSKKKMK